MVKQLLKYIISAKIKTEKEIKLKLKYLENEISDCISILGDDFLLEKIRQKQILEIGEFSNDTFVIKTSLDKAETMLVAAAIEQSDNLKINVTNIRNIQSEKRRNILARAKVLLKKYSLSKISGKKAISSGDF